MMAAKLDEGVPEQATGLMAVPFTFQPSGSGAPVPMAGASLWTTATQP